MKKSRPSVKRAYLPKDHRRRALLDIAAGVVENQGWQALSMISVAEAAQVSRQLVYQHFTSVDELMADTMSHLFRDRYEHIRGNIPSKVGDLAALVKMVEEQTFDEHPGRVRALWQMITATYSDNIETSRMSARLRHLLVKLWAPTMAQQFALPEPQSRAVAWMLLMAFWGAHQLEHDGEINRKTANELFTWMLLRLKGGEQLTAAPRVATNKVGSAAAQKAQGRSREPASKAR